MRNLHLLFLADDVTKLFLMRLKQLKTLFTNLIFDFLLEFCFGQLIILSVE